MSNENNKEELGSLLFPPWRLLRRFLFVTMLLILGTGAVIGIVFNTYFQVDPRWEFASLFPLTVFFCFLNFRVTRGSFLCANILKYYALTLVCICLPTIIFMKEASAGYVLYFITILMLLSAFYLISGQTYQKLIQYQYEFFEDIKEIKENIEKELKMAEKQNKRKTTK